MEYTAEILIKMKSLEGRYPVYYQNADSVKVNTDSLEEALKLIEGEALEKFPKSEYFVHIDKVTRGNNVVYRTVWDDFGPLAAVNYE